MNPHLYLIKEAVSFGELLSQLVQPGALSGVSEAISKSVSGGAEGAAEALKRSLVGSGAGVGGDVLDALSTAGKGYAQHLKGVQGRMAEGASEAIQRGAKAAPEAAEVVQKARPERVTARKVPGGYRPSAAM